MKLIKRICSIFSVPVLFFLSAIGARAHCPLCTAGALAAATGAAYMGVSQAAIGIFMGAFAVSTALWMARIIKKEYIKYQKPLLVIVSFILTIVPIAKFLTDIKPLFIYLIGSYGSILNRTYVVNLFVAGSFIGALITLSTPYLSKKITEMRGKTIPFQGIMLTFSILIGISVIIELVI